MKEKPLPQLGQCVITIMTHHIIPLADYEEDIRSAANVPDGEPMDMGQISDGLLALAKDDFSSLVDEEDLIDAVGPDTVEFNIYPGAKFDGHEPEVEAADLDEEITDEEKALLEQEQGRADLAKANAEGDGAPPIEPPAAPPPPPPPPSPPSPPANKPGVVTKPTGAPTSGTATQSSPGLVDSKTVKPK